MVKKLGLGVLSAALLAAGAAHADLAPPPGAVLDVAALSSTTIQAYTQYSVSFTAGQADTYISFLFRRDPSYFGFDDTSLTAQGSDVNLLVDPGFEEGPLNSQTPIGWGNFQQTSGIPAQGEVETGSGRGGVSPRTGSYFWDDGAVGAYDGIYQAVATTPGQQYTLSFYLSNPESGDAYSQTGTGIDVLAYEGAALPDGTIVTTPAPPISGAPEPSTWALLLGGVGILGGMLRVAQARRREDEVATA